MFKLDESVAKTVASSIGKVEKSELSQTEVFLLVTEQYKLCKTEEQRKDLTVELKKVVESKTKFSSTKATYTRIFNLSSKYTEMFVLAKADLLHYVTLSKLVKIMYYVYNNEAYTTKDYKEVQSKVASVYKEGMGAYSYNNLIDALVHSLREQYHITLTDDDKVIEVNYESVASSVSKLSVDDKLKLLEMLQVELAYDEVA